MDANLTAVFGVFMRWLHILSAVTILGGFLYARYVVAPALASFPAGDAASLSNRAVAQFRPILYTAIVTILLTGLYNYLSKASYPPHYHMVIGIKFLFVLHIFATSVLYTIPNANAGNRLRRLNWLVISGIIVVLISADLRWMTLNALPR
ncbi:MAG: hypothetical protein ACR2NN_22320 [Bryobacteraceae bacterium]